MVVDAHRCLLAPVSDLHDVGFSLFKFGSGHLEPASSRHRVSRPESVFHPENAKPPRRCNVDIPADLLRQSCVCMAESTHMTSCARAYRGAIVRPGGSHDSSGSAWSPPGLQTPQISRGRIQRDEI